MVRSARSGHASMQRGNELVLTAAGVLELVDKQMADIVGDGQRGVAGQIVFAAEDLLGNLRDFNEVDRAGLCEDRLQLGGCVAQAE